eukprot:11176322-Lingulodinium_polyedra.AAC.1
MALGLREEGQYHASPPPLRPHARVGAPAALAVLDLSPGVLEAFSPGAGPADPRAAALDLA